MAFALRKSVLTVRIHLCRVVRSVRQLCSSVCLVDRHRVMKPVALSISGVRPRPGIRHKIQPSLFFYSRRIFPTIEDRSIDQLLSELGSVFVLVKETEFQKQDVKQPYRFYDVRAGFAEDGGEMTLMLIGNGR